MAGEPFTLNVVPKTIGDDPQDLADWIYKVALELEKTVQTELTASNGVILVGTDIQHGDTSSISNVDTSGAQVVDTITFDTFGHVLSFTTRDLTASDIGAEPAFSKNTAFNKDFGSIAGTVLEGDTTLNDLGGTIDLTSQVSGILPLTNGGTGSSTLTAAEISQIENINSVTISNAQWVFVGGANQATKTTDSPTFANLTITSMAANWTNAGRTIADLGIVTTVDINGGTVDGTIVGGGTAADGNFTTLDATGAITGDANINVVGAGISSVISSSLTGSGVVDFQVGNSNAGANSNSIPFEVLGKGVSVFKVTASGVVTLTGILNIGGAILASGDMTLNSGSGSYIYKSPDGSTGLNYILQDDNDVFLQIAGSTSIKWNLGSIIPTFASDIIIDGTTDTTSATTGSIQTDGGLGVVKNVFVGGTITVDGNQITLDNVSSRDKYRVWTGNNFTIGMDASYTFGGLGNDFAMTFQMSNNNTRGFWWGDTGHNNAQGAMALTTDGKWTIAGGGRIGFGGNDTTTPNSDGLEVSGEVFLNLPTTAGTTGSLFEDASGFVKVAP